MEAGSGLYRSGTDRFLCGPDAPRQQGMTASPVAERSEKADGWTLR